jgi:hypothetical protein
VLPAAYFLLALTRFCQAQVQAQGELHLIVSESDGDPVLRRDLCDHPLPLHGAGTRNAWSEFLNGHLQSKDNCCFILVEHSDNAPTVDDRDPPIQRVRNIASFAINFPDAGRGDLIGECLLLLLGYKALLRNLGPICAAVRIGRWADVQAVCFQPCIKPPMIALIRITPSSKLCGRPRISLGCVVRYP